MNRYIVTVRVMRGKTTKSATASKRGDQHAPEVVSTQQDVMVQAVSKKLATRMARVFYAEERGLHVEKVEVTGTIKQ